MECSSIVRAIGNLMQGFSHRPSCRLQLDRSWTIPERTLKILGFFKERVHERGPKAYKTALAKLYPAVHFVVESVILLVLVDTVIPEGDQTLALILAAVYVISTALLMKMDIVQQDLRGRSGTRKFLRTNLVKKCLTMALGVDNFHENSGSYELMKAQDQLGWSTNATFHVEEEPSEFFPYYIHVAHRHSYYNGPLLKPCILSKTVLCVL